MERKRLTCRHQSGRTVLSSDSQVSEALDKLAYYEDLDDKHMLIALPCPIGSRVWVVERDCNGTVGDCSCKPCEDCDDYPYRVNEDIFSYDMIPDIGKFVFTDKPFADAVAQFRNENAILD